MDPEKLSDALASLVTACVLVVVLVAGTALLQWVLSSEQPYIEALIRNTVIMVGAIALTKFYQRKSGGKHKD